MTHRWRHTKMTGAWSALVTAIFSASKWAWDVTGTANAPSEQAKACTIAEGEIIANSQHSPSSCAMDPLSPQCHVRRLTPTVKWGVEDQREAKAELQRRSEQVSAALRGWHCYNRSRSVMRAGEFGFLLHTHTLALPFSFSLRHLLSYYDAARRALSDAKPLDLMCPSRTTANDTFIMNYKV